MDILVNYKTDLIEWLSSDLHILQHAQSDGVIDTRVYRNLMTTRPLTPEAVCIQLIDTITDRGEETSRQFLKLLRKEEILNTYPQLKELDPSSVQPAVRAVPGKR